MFYYKYILKLKRMQIFEEIFIEKRSVIITVREVLFYKTKMFHYFQGEIKTMGGTTFLMGKDFGIQIFYQWNSEKGEFFLFPYFDDQKKTFFYYAFDTFEQKQVFENVLKISWVGTKTAFLISKYSAKELSEAVKNMDTQFFQAIPGIWPKSAKKIILEMKGSFNLEEVETMHKNQKYFTDILKTLKSLGYEGETVKAKLWEYKQSITKENMSQVIKRIISQI